MNSSLTIVIPCYNEEENIPVFFPKLLEFVQKHDFQVIAVNDGSKDNTLQELQKFNDPHLTVISHKCNRGYRHFPVFADVNYPEASKQCRQNMIKRRF